MCESVLTGPRRHMLKQHREGAGPGEGRGQSVVDVGRRRRRRLGGLTADGRPGRQKTNNELPFGDWGRLMRVSGFHFAPVEAKHK